jgi:hypothetical protein
MYKDFLEPTPEEKKINAEIIENRNNLQNSEAYKTYLRIDEELVEKLIELRTKKTSKLLNMFKGEEYKPHVSPKPIKTKDFSHIENHLKEYLNTLSEDEKRAFGRIYSRISGYDKINEYENPVTTIEQIKQLQEILVQVCINFINENKLTDIDEISFNVDSLQNSAKYGEWTSVTDSFIGVDGYQIEDDITVRRRIGEVW